MQGRGVQGQGGVHRIVCELCPAPPGVRGTGLEPMEGVRGVHKADHRVPAGIIMVLCPKLNGFVKWSSPLPGHC